MSKTKKHYKTMYDMIKLKPHQTFAEALCEALGIEAPYRPMRRLRSR